MKKKFYTIPIFIPEEACPFQCVFCDQKKISGHGNIPTETEIVKTIENHLRTLDKNNSVINIGFFGGNFTGIPKEEQENYLRIASGYLNKGDIHGIRLSTRPDYVDKEIVSLLKNYSVTTVELGAQSLDDEVLKKSGRGHKAEDIIKASQLLKVAGISLGLQMMIGLPGDSFDKTFYTARKIVELGAGNTRIYPTLVIKGTKLEQLYNEGKYTPLSLRESVEQSKYLLLFFEENGVDVIRVGLHPSEGLLNGHELTAGPFHPSFKELVLSNIWRDIILSCMVIEKDLFNPIPPEPDNTISGAAEEIIIKTAPDQLNYAIGYNSSNKLMLLERFKNVKFVADGALTKREFNVIYN